MQLPGQVGIVQRESHKISVLLKWISLFGYDWAEGYAKCGKRCRPDQWIPGGRQ